MVASNCNIVRKAFIIEVLKCNSEKSWKKKDFITVKLFTLQQVKVTSIEHIFTFFQCKKFNHRTIYSKSAFTRNNERRFNVQYKF